MKKQVFLGGSCDPTTWRTDVSIPLLTGEGVAFYNPQVPNYSELDAQYKAEGIKGGIAEVEAVAKAESQELLFIIDGQTRAVASILEATEYVVSGRSVALVIDDIPDKTEVQGQVITGRELKDLNRARNYLRELASRHTANCRVFTNAETATSHIISVLNK